MAGPIFSAECNCGAKDGEMHAPACAREAFTKAHAIASGGDVVSVSTIPHTPLVKLEPTSHAMLTEILDLVRSADETRQKVMAQMQPDAKYLPGTKHYPQPKPGDVVRVFHSGDNESHLAACKRVAADLAQRTGCFAVVCPESVGIEALDPEAMRRAGWVRKEEVPEWEAFNERTVTWDQAQSWHLREKLAAAVKKRQEESPEIACDWCSRNRLDGHRLCQRCAELDAAAGKAAPGTDHGAATLVYRDQSGQVKPVGVGCGTLLCNDGTNKITVAGAPKHDGPCDSKTLWEDVRGAGGVLLDRICKGMSPCTLCADGAATLKGSLDEAAAKINAIRGVSVADMQDGPPDAPTEGDALMEFFKGAG